MKKQLFLFKQILILFLMSFIFIGCEQIEFITLFKGISKEDIDNAVLRMKKISLKYSKPVWDVDTDTEQYMEFSFDTIEGTEKVKAIYYESNKRLVVARKDSKLKNVVQLYYIKNISLDSEYINFNNNTFCEDFIMVNLKNGYAIYGNEYTYLDNVMGSTNNMRWINSIIKIRDKKIKYKRIY